MPRNRPNSREIGDKKTKICQSGLARVWKTKITICLKSVGD